MSSEWPILQIQDVCSVGDGAHSKVQRTETGVPYLTSKNIGHGNLKLDKYDFISTESFNKLFPLESKATRRPKPGDLLIGIIGTFGNAYLYKESDSFGFSSSIGIIRPNKEKIVPRYLYYVVTSPKFKSVHIASDGGSAQGYTNIPAIKKLPIYVPPLPAQDAIASLLGVLDDRINLLRETNVTLQAIAQALFKSWFVDFDPVRAKMAGLIPEGMNEATAAMFPNALVESELGAIPNGWRVARLHSLTSAVFSGGTPDTRRPDFWEGDIPWFSSGETRNLVIVDTEKRITKAGVDGSSTRPVRPGDILIASAGQGHTRGQTSYCGIDCYINQSVVALRAGELCKPSWLFFNLVRRYEEMRNLSDSHSSRGSLTTKLLNQMPLVLPPLDIIDAFDNVASTLLTSIISNVKQVQSLSALRDTLLPRLISGQLRLSSVENPIEAIAA